MGIRALAVLLALAATARADNFASRPISRARTTVATSPACRSRRTRRTSGSAAARASTTSGTATGTTRGSRRRRTCIRVFFQAFASTRGIQFHWLDLRRAEDRRLAVPPPQPADLRAQHEPELLRPRRSQPVRAAVPGLAGVHVVRRLHRRPAADLRRPDVRQVRPVRPACADLARERRAPVPRRPRARARRCRPLVRAASATTREARSTRAAARRPRRRPGSRPTARRMLIVGCGGGRDNGLRLGISYDTRDFEPDPNRGVFLDAASTSARVALGSQYDYVRFARRGARLLLADPRARRPRARGARDVRLADLRHAVLLDEYVPVHRRAAHRASAATARCAGSARTASSGR